MSADVSTIDLADETTAEQIAVAEREANRIVWEDRPVSIQFATPEQAAAMPLRKEPVRGGTLRLIDISDYDLSACGGTHVARTGAIGIIAVSAWERFRGGTRLTFVCGGRVLRLFRSFRESITGSIRTLSVLPEELPSAIERVQNESKELRRTVKLLQDSLASHVAARMIAEAPRVGTVYLIVQAVDDWDAQGLKAIATAATAGESAAVALTSASTPSLVVVARSRNVPLDSNAVLKELMQQFGGRGGGKPDMAQGGGLNATAPQIAEAARLIIERELAARPNG
jgi:alanyl-tRNA synthetase